MAPFPDVEKTFWDPEITRGSQPPLTPSLVADCEAVLGVALPPELLRLLVIRNGGVVSDRWDSFPIGPDDHAPFGVVFGVGPPDRPGAITLSDTPYLIGEWDLPSSVVLISTFSYSWVALDYRSGPSPSVVRLSDGSETVLAPDFRGFVERLGPTPED